MLQILTDEIANYAYSHGSFPIYNIQFGFWYFNSSCLLCHSNIGNIDVNPRKKGPLILSVNFQFLSTDESQFLELLEDVSKPGSVCKKMKTRLKITAM